MPLAPSATADVGFTVEGSAATPTGCLYRGFTCKLQ
jgi:hypothetical protein